MKTLERLALGFVTALCLSLPASPVQADSPARDWWQTLEVRSPDQEPVVPAGRWIIFVFLSPECPLANASLPTLNALAKEFAPRGAFLVGVYADPALSPETLRQHTKDFAIGFATVDDRLHRLVRFTGATYTPEVFVYSRAGTRLYLGRIDDRVGDFGSARPAATRQDLREVLVALVEGQPGPFPERKGFGCSISEPVKQ